MAATDKRMSQSFVSLKPPSLKNGSLEHITSSDYKCRIYIKRIFHPASCIVSSMLTVFILDVVIDKVTGIH